MGISCQTASRLTRLTAFSFAVAAFALLASGCAPAYQNTLLNGPDASWFPEKHANATRAGGCSQDDDHWFVGVAISGGGLRSTHFALAAMQALDELGLLQRVDCISGVSGGSLAAAYYCASGPADWNAAAIHSHFDHRFINQLALRVFLPWNLLALTFSSWDRTDVLAELFESEIFTRDGRRLTFADLNPARPRLIVNATEIQTGKKFTFTNESFDAINSTLRDYPLGWACAASSAAPLLLHPVTIRDFAQQDERYIHLVDGGVVDNLGVRSLVETYDRNKKSTPGVYSRGAVIIVLDARVPTVGDYSRESDLGTFEAMWANTNMSFTELLNSVSSSSIADIILRNSSPDSTVGQLVKQLDELHETGRVELKDKEGKPVYVFHLSFDRAKKSLDAQGRSILESLNKIGTNFNIDTQEVSDLQAAARYLVETQMHGQLVDVLKRVQADQPASSRSTSPASRASLRPPAP